MELEDSGYLVLDVMECGMADRATLSRVMAQPDTAGDIVPEARIMEAATNRHLLTLLVGRSSVDAPQGGLHGERPIQSY